MGQRYGRSSKIRSEEMNEVQHIKTVVRCLGPAIVARIEGDKAMLLFGKGGFLHVAWKSVQQAALELKEARHCHRISGRGRHEEHDHAG